MAKADKTVYNRLGRKLHIILQEYSNSQFEHHIQNIDNSNEHNI